MANTQVRSLTGEQWNLVEQVRAEWLGHALTTEPADRAAAETAIAALYELRGLGPPRFVWVDSPATGSLALWLLSGVTTEEGSPLVGTLREALSDPLWDAIGGGLRDSVSASLGESVGDLLPRAGRVHDLLHDPYRSFAEATTGLFGLDLLSGYPPWWEWATLFRNVRRMPEPVRRRRLHDVSLGDALRRTVNRQVHESLRKAIERSWGPTDLDTVLRAQRQALRDTLLIGLGEASDWEADPLRRSLARSLRASATGHRGGLDEIGWIARYDLYRRLGVVEYHPNAQLRLDLVADILRSAGRWWPHPAACVVAERPTRLAVEPTDSGMRSHSPQGAAIEYRDGFAAYVWHGVVVPRQVIGGEVTGRDWEREPDEQVRAAIADRMGYDWLLGRVPAQRIATDESGSLWQLPHDLVLLEATGGVPGLSGPTRRRVVPVPPDQRVPRDAARLAFGTDPS
ncbi:DUF6745 domain-containing protein [Rugosimonospora africana]|uniref:DUF6745 domain-containing protein n=1 Tax=Rugosimonospora africana TaxID=556532 RepID=A0A8J3VT14_9ACTN|nr:hypothetical protein [Rugosimonospora africana]GIH17937.1 hypothetical protein Raf01_61090 [Rugosimonospora africana]